MLFPANSSYQRKLHVALSHICYMYKYDLLAAQSELVLVH